MTGRPQRLARGGRVATIATTVAVVAVAFAGASAASLGGLRSTSLYTVTAAQSPVIPTTTTTIPPTTIPPTTTVPTPVAISCDSFGVAAPTKNDLNGRVVQPPSCGNFQWKVNAGDWKLAGSEAFASEPSQATITGPQVNVTAEVTLSNLNGANRSGGIILNRSGGGGSGVMLVGVLIGNGSAAIRIRNGGTTTTLLTVPVSAGSSARLRLTRLGTKVTMRVNGTVVATLTLTVAQANLLSGLDAGIINEQGTALRYSNFLLAQPTP
jgi:hypothetical protein